MHNAGLVLCHATTKGGRLYILDEMVDVSYTSCIITSTEVPKSRPTHDITEFLAACQGDGRHPSHVVLMGGVGRTAARDFSLKTKAVVLAFIAAGGLENLEFVNSLPFRLSDEIPPPLCDAYTFTSGFTVGYISFFYSEPNEKWVIKSFHRDHACGPTMMEIALRDAGLLPAHIHGGE